ncbi:hypothetical protein Mapa_015478 [Marchantia paleacea]|nr:hypothetical protein Mapa_015478 [Marchantia paleacea]
MPLLAAAVVGPCRCPSIVGTAGKGRRSCSKSPSANDLHFYDVRNFRSKDPIGLKPKLNLASRRLRREIVVTPVAKISEEKVPASVSSLEYPEETGVIVVGAGLAGLAAAKHLAKEGLSFVLLEASNGVGGRVRTDEFEGFLLDRGFQIHITAYPEAQRVLDYDRLDLKRFYAGAMVWFNGQFHRVADPFRHFTDGLGSLTNPIGSVLDKLLVGIVRFRAAVKGVDDILATEETTIEERLSNEGFSEAMVDRFFRPFFGGIFFDRELQTTSRLFEFVFKCLALGSNTLPTTGIGAIPKQLLASLPPRSLFLNSKVTGLVEGSGVISGVKLENGEQIKAKYGVIVAVEGPEAARLMKDKLPETPSVTKTPRSTVCLYFKSDKAPFTSEPVLILNGTNKGIVNNMFFPSNVVPSYAPPGKTLVSVSLIGTHEGTPDVDLEASVRNELSEWFGKEFVDSWKHLRTYRIPFAQPDQSPPTELRKNPRLSDGLYVCGDHRNSSTFDGALVSGRVAVQALLRDRELAKSP